VLPPPFTYSMRTLLVVFISALLITAAVSFIIGRSTIDPLESQASILQEEIIRLEAPPPAQEKSQNLREQIMRFHSAIEDFDVDQVMTFYVNPGTRVDWKGQAGVLEGTYPEWSNVRLLWGALMGNLQDIQITMSHYQAAIVGDEALVTYIIINTGRGTLIGDYRMVVSVNTTWIFVDGDWIIEEDSWDFILWEAEIVAITLDNSIESLFSGETHSILTAYNIESLTVRFMDGSGEKSKGSCCLSASNTLSPPGNSMNDSVVTV